MITTTCLMFVDGAHGPLQPDPSAPASPPPASASGPPSAPPSPTGLLGLSSELQPMTNGSGNAVSAMRSGSLVSMGKSVTGLERRRYPALVKQSSVLAAT